MAQEQMDPIVIVNENLDQCDVLDQLAEEAAELAHAALKLSRAYKGVNPTPVKPCNAYAALLEEVADVQVCLSVLGLDGGVPRMEIGMIAQRKLLRWAHRIEERKEEECD